MYYSSPIEYLSCDCIKPIVNVIANKMVDSGVILILGDVGHGKSALIRSLGYEVDTGEEILNKLRVSIKLKNQNEFRQWLRSKKVLLVDDIHVWKGKEFIQEEMVHTIDALLSHGGVIVFSCLSGLWEEPPEWHGRLESRIRQGILLELPRPCDGLMRAILVAEKTRLEIEGLGKDTRDIDALLLAASDRNIRKLKGFLCGLKNLTMINGDLSKNLVETILLKKNSDPMDLKIKKLFLEVKKTYGVSCQEIKSNSRKKRLVVCRRILAFILRKKLRLGLKEIADQLDIHHSSVVYHVRSCEQKIKEDSYFRECVRDIESQI